MEFTVCPQCTEPAEIQWRAVLDGTEGPVEHAKVLCVRRHWFLLPTAMLASPLSWPHGVGQTVPGHLRLRGT